ncbi:MAG: hypothetical protein IT237_03265 [Bacteroidia bacterium]|nr:hypothetical protein [Bacteroidia bacterium]
MSNYYETGHAKNVANLLRLNQLIATFGANYNPSNNAIKATALATLYTNANTKLSDVNNNFTTWKNATNARELAFDPLRKEVTQLLGALQSTGATQQTIDDLAFQVNKFRTSGSKLTKADSGIVDTTPAEKVVAPTDPIETKTISTSQQSYDNQLQHFQKIILILQSVPAYNPNEVPFKVATLQTQLTNLSNINNAANTSYANLKNARIQRNLFFYAKDTGLLDLVKQTKAYIKSLYGSKSQQYIAANAIKFTRVIPKKSAQ